MDKAPYKSVSDIRAAFLRFFEQQGHKLLPGSSLVPHNDPSLLFTNAGMNQFKEIFLGQIDPPFPAVVTAQWCLRAGGKHNDLENIGYTTRHHTLFEMLGNFSFGAYSKKRAIELAWTFLTDPDNGLGLPPQRLWVTIYRDDEEAALIWKGLSDFDSKKLVRIGDLAGQPYVSDNFWKMGDTGPCGPCTEIFYDYGPEFFGTPPGEEQEGERFVEIWNLVFMQFMQEKSGEMRALPKLGVDTGMGLERIAAVLQQTHDNYSTDMFRQIMQATATLLGVPCRVDNPHLRVIADHCRATAFMLAEGILPENQGRGYVLRRIIRRSVLHAHKLGARGAKLFLLIPELAAVMGSAAAVLTGKIKKIQEQLRYEEEAFYRTLSQGLALFETKLKNAGLAREFSGQDAFQLYDTYGFPFDLTQKLCKDHGLTVNSDEFDACMDEQKARSKMHQKFDQVQRDQQLEEKLSELADTIFLGYEQHNSSAKILKIFNESGEELLQYSGTGPLQVILDQTTFYPTGGGQPGDRGRLLLPQGMLEIKDTQILKEKIIHIGSLAPNSLIQTGATVQTEIDSERRKALARHHSCTHLLHAALQELFGENLTQAGSALDVDQFRFDFYFERPLSGAELQRLSFRVNEQVQACLRVKTQICDREQAKQQGARALFEHKYREKVRLVSIGKSSKELCGGTHVQCSGEIGYFHILGQSSLAKGTRRIEACSGKAALKKIQEERQIVAALGQRAKCTVEEVPHRIEKVFSDLKDQAHLVKKWKKKAALLFYLQLKQKIEGASRSYCGEVLSFDREFLQETARLVLGTHLENLVLITAQGCGASRNFGVFAARGPKSHLSLDLVQNFLENYGSLRGGGNQYQKFWTIEAPSLDQKSLVDLFQEFFNENTPEIFGSSSE